MNNLYRTTPASTAPVVTVAEATEAARVDGPELEGLFAGYIAAATAMAEQELSRKLLTQSWRLETFTWGVADGPRKGISIKLAPFKSVDAVTWFDGAAWQPLPTSQYEVLPEQCGVRIVPALGVVWPVLGAGDGYRVRVDLTVGYGAPADVPECIKLFIKAHCAHWFRHPMAAGADKLEVSPLLSNLLDPERSWYA